MIKSMSLNLARRQLPTETDNTKKLSDICLECISKNLHSIQQVGRYLTPVHKEVIIERLAYHDMLTPSYLPHITYNLFAPQLRSINLFKCRQVTDAFLSQLGATRCKLQKLTIHDCTNVTDAGIIAVTYGQDELISLELRKLMHLKSKGLSEIFSPALRQVDFRGCNCLTADGIRTLVKRNKTISSLNLVLCIKIDVSVFAFVAQALKGNLVALDAAELHTMSDESLIAIANNCPNLKHFNIHGSNRVTHRGVMKLLEKCPALESLDLSYCSQLSQPPGSGCLLHLPEQVRELSLCGIMIDDCELFTAAMTRLKNIRAVRLCGVLALNDDTMHQVLSIIGRQLEMLDLSGSIMSSVTDEGMRAVARYCTSLNILCMSLLKHITGVTLLPCLRDSQRSQNFKTLLLSCRKLDSEVLYTMASQCSNLQDLDISGLLVVEDSLLFCLAENCPRLSHVNLKGCRKVTDAGVCELAYSCPLINVVLSGIQNLTDRSIFALANSCPNLEEIYLNGCSQITRQAVQYLLDCCIPRLFIQHKVPNAHPDQLMAKNLDTGEFCRADLLDGSQ